MKKLLILITLFLGITSCKTIEKIEYKEIHTTDTIYLNHVLYDSIYIKEAEKTIADTVYLTRETFKYKYRTDTLILYKDSIQIEYVTKIEEVEKPIPSIYKWSLAIAILLIIGIIVYIIIRIYKRFNYVI